MFADRYQRGFDPAEGPVPSLAWPPSFVARPSEMVIVYLDLNHWIGLAQAVTGHRLGVRHQPVLEACRKARSKGTAVFPMSDAHYVEVSKIKSPQQRRDLASIMEELSDFTTLLALPDVMRIELDVALAHVLDNGGRRLTDLPLLGRGVFWAFGRRGLRIREGDKDITEEFQQDHPERFDEMFRLAERMILAGPRDDQVAGMRARGWQPDTAFRVAEERAQQEREQVTRFDADDRWRRGRIRDVILARELQVELLPDVPGGARFSIPASRPLRG